MKEKNLDMKLWGSRVMSMLAAVLIVGLFWSFQAEAGEVTSGTLGDNNGIQWVYDEDAKTLTVTGEDSGLCDSGTKSPFYAISSDVEKIVIENCTLHGSVRSLFRNLKNLKEIQFDNFDTENITDMGYMFYECSSLTDLDLRGFATNNVEDMEYMFSGCDNLMSLDISNFDTGNVENMKFMFEGCGSLSSLDVSNFDTRNVMSMYGIFRNCSSIASLDLSNFNIDNVKNLGYFFYGCKSLTNLDLSSFVTGQVTSMHNMFNSCSSLSSLDVSNFNTEKVSDMTAMFYGCSSLTSLDLSNFSTGKVTDMYDMFYGCSSLTSLDLSNFNTEKVSDMHRVFYGCSSLTSLDLSNFNTEKVTDMHRMFYGCSSLTSLDLNSFSTGNVTSIYGIFSDCSSIASLDISGFDTSQVTYMADILTNCTSLNVIQTPAAMTATQSIKLPDEYIDSKGNATYVLTAEFCNDMLTRYNPFADVPFEKWYYKFVKKAYDKEYMSGVGKTEDGLVIFKPEGDITREQFVQILYNIEGKPAVQYQDIFPDVPEQSDTVWYSNAIMWAAENNIVSGYNNGLFGVGDNITREQVAVILLKYAAYRGYDTSNRADLEELREAYLDVDEIHGWAADSMCWAVKSGVMKGTAGGKLMPLGNATRAEAATMLLNMLAAYGE